MKSFDYYKEKIQTINHALDEHLDAVLEDGVIDYEEAVETKELTADFAKQLRTLKRELNLDIREVRSGYQLQINNAPRREKSSLRKTKYNALAPYNTIKLRIDKILLNIANIKDTSPEGSLKIFEELDDLAKTTLTSPIVSPDAARASDATPDGDFDNDEEESVPLEEIQVLQTRWQGLLRSVEEVLAGGKSSARHRIRLKTAEHVLNIVLEDIGHLIEE